MALHLDFDSLVEKLYEPMLPVMKKRLAKDLEDLDEKNLTINLKKRLDEAKEFEETKWLIPYIEKLLAQPLKMNDKILGEYTRRRAGVLASAWTQLLAYDLDERLSITLDQSLMPYEKQVNPRVWYAWLETINSARLYNQDVRDTLKNFADQILSPSLPAYLPFNTIIEPFSSTEYKAKRLK